MKLKREKFIYNKNSLSYEKVERNWKFRLLQGIGFSSAVMVFAVVIFLAAYNFFDSPKEKLLKSELEAMKLQYETIDKQIAQLSDNIQYYRQRDDNVYRMMLEMEPMDSYIWNSGVGGSSKFEKLQNYSNSELMVETSEKVEKLTRQLELQKQSLSAVYSQIKDNEKKLASIPSIRPVRKLTREVKLFSGFGKRLHPIHKIWKMHWGIDFTAPQGTPIYATGNGRIESVTKSKSGYGNRVLIDHGYGYESLYAHMHTINVKRGQQVKKGDIIGSVGNSGTSTAPHLHYEVIHKGKKVNPIHFVMEDLSPKEYSEMVEAASQMNQAFDGGGEETNP